jgi:hypothetical protein
MAIFVGQSITINQRERMLEAFQEQLNTPDINHLSFKERFALLFEREYLVRENRKLINRQRQAK